MKALVSLALFLSAASVFASDVQALNCAFDLRPVDGDAATISLKKIPGTDLYAFAAHTWSSPMSTTEPRETQTPEGFKVQFGCTFSAKYPGLFKCAEVTPDGFRGKATLESKISLGGMYGEAIEVSMETPSLTYNGSFSPSDCKIQ